MKLKSKQEEIFGRDQGINGGGPYLVCSKTIFRPPETLEQHSETHVKGFCQLSKTFETCGQAFHCYFAEGLMPIIFVRNKGGATVGTADMSNGIVEFNAVVKVRPLERTETTLSCPRRHRWSPV